MSSFTKVVFPIPPPTINDLSSHQRTQLLRKAKKLEQIFGVTPHLVDDTLEPSGPIHVAFPRRPSQRQPTLTGRESLDSISSTSSCESSPGKQASSAHSIHGINSHRSRASSSINEVDSFESWPGKAKGPVMKLFMKAPTLETIPASPCPDNMVFPNVPLQSPMDHSPDTFITQFALTPDEDPALHDSTIMDSYDIISLNSLRKQKMDRLRRRLGQDVPFDLVFQSDTNSGPSITSDNLADVNKERSAFLPLPVLHVGTSSGRISTTRNSIDKSASVHRARHRAQSSSISGPIPTHNRSASAPSKPRQIIPSLPFIIESPDEHGVGCAEEFGQSRKPGGNNSKFKSEWTVSTGGAEVKVWSTRRGYEGWYPKSSSTTTLQIPSISPPPISPSLPPPPPNTESKKKPPSYRKPVPPIPDDCC